MDHEVAVVQSAGLHDLLSSDLGYAAKYEHLVQTAKKLAAGALRTAYKCEYSSWANRKHTAKKNQIGWAACMEDFADFLLVAGPIPQESWTLDRIDNKGDYVPENIRWASKSVQSQNRSCRVEIELGNAKYTISELAQRTGRSYNAVRMGIRRGQGYLTGLLQELAQSSANSEEMAWQFPTDYRVALEAEYANRDQQQQSRLRFFISLVRAEYHRAANASWQPNVSDESKHEIALLRSLHNRAAEDFRKIQERAHWRRVEAKLRAFGLKIPPAATPEREEPGEYPGLRNDPDWPMPVVRV